MKTNDMEQLPPELEKLFAELEQPSILIESNAGEDAISRPTCFGYIGFGRKISVCDGCAIKRSCMNETHKLTGRFDLPSLRYDLENEAYRMRAADEQAAATAAQSGIACGTSEDQPPRTDMPVTSAVLDGPRATHTEPKTEVTAQATSTAAPGARDADDGGERLNDRPPCPADGGVTHALCGKVDHAPSCSKRSQPPAICNSTEVGQPTTGASVGPEKQSEYRFPDEDPVFVEAYGRAQALSAVELLVEIERVSGYDALGHLAPYETIRSVFCALSIALNGRKVYPPAFRHTRKIRPAPPGRKFSKADSDLSNDRQVVDLHWLSKNADVKPLPRFLALMQQFTFSGASRFVAQQGAVSRKVNILRISEQHQRLLGVLNDRAARDHARHTEQGLTRVEQFARGPADPRSRLPAESLALLPDAYVALRVANGSPSVAAAMMNDIFGRVVTVDRVRKCRKFLVGSGLLKV